MFSPEERRRAVELYFTTPMNHGPVGEASGLSDQAVPGTLAGKGSQACWPYGETHHPTGDEDQGRSSWCWAACGRSRPRRRVEEPELENAVMREVIEARRKRPGRRPAAPVEQGEDASGRPSAPDVFTQLDDMLARHRTEQPPTATTPSSPTGCSSRLRRRCRRERIPWRVPTTAATAGGPDRYDLTRSTGAKGCFPRTTPPRRGSSDA